jgi:hypothetical protein
MLKTVHKKLAIEAHQYCEGVERDSVVSGIKILLQAYRYYDIMCVKSHKNTRQNIPPIIENEPIPLVVTEVALFPQTSCPLGKSNLFFSLSPLLY